jgi:hypothetical protein
MRKLVAVMEVNPKQNSAVLVMLSFVITDF